MIFLEYDTILSVIHLHTKNNTHPSQEKREQTLNFFTHLNVAQ